MFVYIDNDSDINNDSDIDIVKSYMHALYVINLYVCMYTLVLLKPYTFMYKIVRMFSNVGANDLILEY